MSATMSRTNGAQRSSNRARHKAASSCDTHPFGNLGSCGGTSGVILAMSGTPFLGLSHLSRTHDTARHSAMSGPHGGSGRVSNLEPGWSPRSRFRLER